MGWHVHVCANDPNVTTRKCALGQSTKGLEMVQPNTSKTVFFQMPDTVVQNYKIAYNPHQIVDWDSSLGMLLSLRCLVDTPWYYPDRRYFGL